MAKRFGRSSEKLSADQLGLFNEAEATAPADPEVGADPLFRRELVYHIGSWERFRQPEAIVCVPAHQRVRPGRKPLRPSSDHSLGTRTRAHARASAQGAARVSLSSPCSPLRRTRTQFRKGSARIARWG
ncbi:MAG: transposase domain-containing protein [Actinomycetota bacterium]